MEIYSLDKSYDRSDAGGKEEVREEFSLSFWDSMRSQALCSSHSEWPLQKYLDRCKNIDTNNANECCYSYH